MRKRNLWQGRGDLAGRVCVFCKHKQYYMHFLLGEFHAKYLMEKSAHAVLWCHGVMFR